MVPDFEGKDLDGVMTLRSLDDAVRLSEAAEQAKRVVVIGAGFIGLEAAAFLTKRGLSVTVLSREEIPFAKRFGEAVGAALKQYHSGNGITFVTGTVARIAGNGRVASVETEDGGSLPADLVLIGAGAAPETGIVAGVEPDEKGGLRVGADLTLADRVWIAGDIAAFPEHGSGVTARIEHWRLAQQHGTHAAGRSWGRRAISSLRRSSGATRATSASTTAATRRISSGSSCRATRRRSTSSPTMSGRVGRSRPAASAATSRSRRSCTCWARAGCRIRRRSRAVPIWPRWCDGTCTRTHAFRLTPPAVREAGPSREAP